MNHIDIQPKSGYSSVTYTDQGALVEIYETALYQDQTDGTIDVTRAVIFSSGHDIVLTAGEARQLAEHLVRAAQAMEGQ